MWAHNYLGELATELLAKEAGLPSNESSTLGSERAAEHACVAGQITAGEHVGAAGTRWARLHPGECIRLFHRLDEHAMRLLFLW